MSEESHTNVAGVHKRCCKCGKDLTGRTRYKNHEGYWCASCNAADEQRRSRLARDMRAERQARIKQRVTLASLGLVLLLLMLFTYMWML